jgi:hypothetical protein
MGELMSYERLCDWFQPYWSKSTAELKPIVAAKLQELRDDAREGGWEKIS